MLDTDKESINSENENFLKDSTSEKKETSKGINDSFRSKFCDNSKNKYAKIQILQDISYRNKLKEKVLLDQISIARIENAYTSHIFTYNERHRMNLYESVDYNTSDIMIFKEQLMHADYAKSMKRNEVWKLFLFILIGISVGLWSTMLLQTVDWLIEFKLYVVSMVLYAGAPTTGCAAYLLGGAALAAVSALCCAAAPPAAGSGVPEAMAHLNGARLPRLFAPRVLLAKAAGCASAVAAGLPVGAEGPLIFTGALLGAAVPAAPPDRRDFTSAGVAAGVTCAFSSPLGGLVFLFEEMATIFTSKLGGFVLISCMACTSVMYFVTSYIEGWKIVDRSYLFPGDYLPKFTSLFEVSNFNIENSLFNVAIIIPSLFIGILLGLLAVIFIKLNHNASQWREKYIQHNGIIWKMMEPIAMTIIFTTLNYYISTMYACQTIPPGLKLFEQFYSPMNATHCNWTNENTSVKGQPWNHVIADRSYSTVRTIRLFTAFCNDPMNEYNPHATISLSSPYNSIRLLYNREYVNIVPISSLALLLAQYVVGAAVCSGMFISVGLVIPTILIGALAGRLLGLLFQASWCNPGVTALIGSVAFFSGISRLTFSLIVIIIEMTRDTTHIICFILVSIIARAVANQLSHSLYEKQMEFKCIPFLNEATQQLHKIDMYTVSNIMSSPAICFKNIERIDYIINILFNTEHNGFPIITSSYAYELDQAEFINTEVSKSNVSTFSVKNTKDSNKEYTSIPNPVLSSNIDVVQSELEDIHSIAGKYIGIIQRSDLITLLWYIKLYLNKDKIIVDDERDCNDGIIMHPTPELYKKVHDYMLENHINPEGKPMDITEFESMRGKYLDLMPYTNTCNYYVHGTMNISRTYNLFRTLGLRHLPVLDENHKVKGILTRKNLMGFHINEVIAKLNNKKIKLN